MELKYMSKQESFIGTFQSYKNTERYIFGRDSKNTTVNKWVLANVMQPYIRRDYYQARLRHDINKYGIAINRYALAQPFPNNTPLISDLIAVNPCEFAWEQPTLAIYERRKPPETQNTEVVHDFDREGSTVLYGQLVIGLSIFEGVVRQMIERSADPSEVADILKLAAFDPLRQCVPDKN